MTSYTSRLTRGFDPGPTSARYARILEALFDAQVSAGIIPGPSSDLVRGVYISESEWAQRTDEIRHETAAWVDLWRQRQPEHIRPQTYLGLTSSNLIDTSFAIALYSYRGELATGLIHLADELEQVASSLKGLTREGRTHGQWAAPVPRSATYLRYAHRARHLARSWWSRTVPAALHGPTGHPTPAITREVLGEVSRALGGVHWDPHPTQVADRWSRSDLHVLLYQTTALCSAIATFHRLEALPEINRFSESFQVGAHKGSSSMPHKNNPARSERVCGLTRVARGHLVALLETTADAWWERDLTNSSVERVAERGLLDLAGLAVSETLDIMRTADFRQTESAPLPSQCYTHHELVRRAMEGEDPERAYRDIQERNLNG